MKKDSLIITASVMLLMVMDCGRTNPASPAMSDEEAVKLLLSSSGYADCSDYADDGLAGFPLPGAKVDSFPGGIYFLRRIENRWSQALIGFDPGRTSAWAEVRAGSQGRLVLDNNSDGVCDTFWHPVNDQGQRNVAFRKSGGRWQVYGASPMAVQTVLALDPVLIDSLRTEGSSGLRTRAVYRREDQGRVWPREEMPAFSPGAVITITVWGGPAGGSDSCWAFVHRRLLQDGLEAHLRLPMVRQEGRAFSFSWIAEPAAGPAVRQAAVNLVLGSALFGDSTGKYSACIWTVPYIITDSDSLPQ
jgi:hypothetical protein